MQDKSTKSSIQPGTKKDDKTVIAPGIAEQIPLVRAIGLGQNVPGYVDSAFSDNHLAFCIAFVETGGDIKCAERASGYANSYGIQLLSRPEFIQLIQALTKIRIKTEGYAAAAKAVIDIMRDPGAPAAARATCVKIAREWAEEKTGTDQGSGKSLSEMSVGELAGLIDKLEDVAQLQAKTIDITKDNQ